MIAATCLAVAVAASLAAEPEAKPASPDEASAVVWEWSVTAFGRFPSKVPPEKWSVRADGTLLDRDGKEAGRVPAELVRETVADAVGRGFLGLKDGDPLDAGLHLLIRMKADGKEHSVGVWTQSSDFAKANPAAGAVYSRLSILPAVARLGGENLDKAVEAANRIVAKEVAVTKWDLAAGSGKNDGFSAEFRRSAPGGGTSTVKVTRTGRTTEVTVVVSGK
jgi:hypothetical protein